MIIGNLEGKPAEFSSSHLTLVFDVVCGLCTEEMHINKQKPIVSIFTESPPHSGKIKTESIHKVYMTSKYLCTYLVGILFLRNIFHLMQEEGNGINLKMERVFKRSCWVRELAS